MGLGCPAAASDQANAQAEEFGHGIAERLGGFLRRAGNR